MKVLVTGAAGFIGAAVAARLLERGDEVTGLDNLNAYYEVSLKQERLERLRAHQGFRFVRADLADAAAVAALFAAGRYARVVHLGAQAGVRHSLTEPAAYVSSNITGTFNVLEGCRATGVEHLVFASTSSVYGAQTRVPYREDSPAVHPLSLYAASKRAGELMSHSYACIHGLPVTVLRLFTVYGPWGRPDMALVRFSHAIMRGEPIELFNRGDHRRDFTYIDDAVEGLQRVVDRIAAPDDRWNGQAPDPASSLAPFRVYNLGSGRPVELRTFLELLERGLGRRAEQRLLALQPGDMVETYADVSRLAGAVGYVPDTPLEVGVQRFAEWFRDYYGYS